MQVNFYHEEGNKTKKLLESTLSVEVGDIKAETPPGITCSDGTPTGKISSGEEQDAQPEPSALIDLTNFELSEKRHRHIDMERIIMNVKLSDEEINLAQELLKLQFPKINGLQ